MENKIKKSMRSMKIIEISNFFLYSAIIISAFIGASIPCCIILFIIQLYNSNIAKRKIAKYIKQLKDQLKEEL